MSNAVGPLHQELTRVANHSTPRWLGRLVALEPRHFVALLAGVILVERGAGFFVSFYSGDEATYSALARRILAGAIPYASAVDHKPVGIELVYAAVYALPGALGLRAVRALFLGVIWLTALGLGELAARLAEADGLDATAQRRVARIAALAYAMGSAWGFASDVQAANTELLLDLPLTFAAIACLHASRGRAPFGLGAAAGVLVGLAGLCKYQSALVGGAFAIFAVLAAPRPFAWRLLAGLATGFAAVALGYAGSFALTGHWDAFVFWGWRFNFSYMSILSAPTIAHNAASRTAWIALIWAPLWLGLVATARTPTRDVLLCGAWLSAAGLAICCGGRFFCHYYLIALPPLAVGGARGLLRILDGGGRPARLVLGLGALATGASLAMAWSWYALKPGLGAYAHTYAAVGDYLHAHSAPDDRVFVWGNSPEIYELAGRRMGTRFPFCNYHTGLIWGSPLYDDGAPGAEAYVVPRAWTELLADLRAAPPAFIVDAAAGGLDHFERHGIARYAPLQAFVGERYLRAADVAGVPIWRRR